MSKEGLTILMPCLNEAETLGKCIGKAKTFLAENNMQGEVLIADNGSTDGSIEIAKNMGARVINVEKKGYGSALKAGIDAADYEYIIMGDADDSYDFLDLKKYVDKLDEGYDLVMGNRFKGGIEKDAMPFSHRYIGNPVLSGIGRIFYNTKIGDFHCGQRGFRKSSIQKINLCTSGMEFASEMVVKAVLFDLRIAEVPCHLYPDGRNRPPHLRSIPDGWRHLKFLLIYSPKWLFLYPGVFLFALGTVFSVVIALNPLQIGRVVFEVTTMFYFSMLLLLGVQFMLFSVYADIMGRRIGQFPQKSSLESGIETFLEGWGMVIGTIGIFIGVIGIIVTLRLWANVDFSMLTDTSIPRMAILFGTCLLIGVELLLAGFFVNILKMGMARG